MIARLLLVVSALLLRSALGYAQCDPGQQAGAAVQTQPPEDAAEISSWSAIDASGLGILLGKGDWGQLSLSGYAVIRYIDQLPARQTFTDHLGNVRTIDPRNDIQFHRAMLHFRGWLRSPKLRYQVTVWSVLSTNQTTLYGFGGYQFDKKFNVYAGINSVGGSRSLMGSHPFWLANDRVLADEFFRPGFTGTVWVNGEVQPGLWYHAAVGNSRSSRSTTRPPTASSVSTSAASGARPCRARSVRHST